MTAFTDRLRAAMAARASRLCVSLDVQIPDTPLPILPADEPMLPFARAIIEATADVVCAYQIRPMYFLAEGAAGMVALERLTRLIPEDTPLIIDLRVDDPAEATLAARSAFYQLRASAITARADLPAAAVAAIANYDGGGRGLFARFAGSPQSLPEPWSGYSLPADAAELGMARAANPARFALVQDCDRLAPREATAAAAGNTVAVVGRGVLYASKRMDFDRQARDAAVRYREIFGPPKGG